MRNMGNTKANSIYNPDESRHPPPTNTSEFNDRDSELEKFIRRKYVEGRFKPSAAGHVEEVSRPRASSIRANGTGTSSTGSFQRQSPNPELNDIVVPRTRATVGGSTEEPRPPIFATRSSGNGMGVTDSPGRSRPRPTHSATLEIPVLSHEESSAYSLDHPSGSGGRPGSSSGSRPRSFLSTAGRGATKNMVQDNWNDLMMASSADETQTGPGGRRSPNPFARAQSANAGRSTTARPESGRQAVAPALEARYGNRSWVNIGFERFGPRWSADVDAIVWGTVSSAATAAADDAIELCDTHKPTLYERDGQRFHVDAVLVKRDEREYGNGHGDERRDEHANP
jgi:hypothetical protein